MRLDDKGQVYKVKKKQRGDWSEVLAVAWLMERGYEVYAPFGEGLIDLIAYETEIRTMIRVEVKTAQPHVTKGGELRFYWRQRDVQMEHVDMLLVVTHDGTVIDATGITSPISSSLLVPEGDKGHVRVGTVMDVIDHSSRRKGAGRRPVMDDHGNRIVYD
jgi:Holliday junction resolvase-like predicted endonuclease